jgi:hypothetical protein
MAATISNCTAVEHRAVIPFNLWPEGVKTSEIYKEIKIVIPMLQSALQHRTFRQHVSSTLFEKSSNSWPVHSLKLFHISHLGQLYIYIYM